MHGSLIILWIILPNNIASINHIFSLFHVTFNKNLMHFNINQMLRLKSTCMKNMLKTQQAGILEEIMHHKISIIIKLININYCFLWYDYLLYFVSAQLSYVMMLWWTLLLYSLYLCNLHYVKYLSILSSNPACNAWSEIAMT